MRPILTHVVVYMFMFALVATRENFKNDRTHRNAACGTDSRAGAQGTLSTEGVHVGADSTW